MDRKPPSQRPEGPPDDDFARMVRSKFQEDLRGMNDREVLEFIQKLREAYKEIGHQELRELVRAVNERSMAETGHVQLVAVEFRKDGEPITYQPWSELHPEAAAPTGE